MFIFRAGLPVAVPADYASHPEHVAQVEFLTATPQYAEAVRFLEAHAVSWLAADILRGAPWAQRYLNTTARLSQSTNPTERRLAAGGVRALMRCLTGTRTHVGRRRSAPLTPEALARGAAAIAKWRAVVDRAWSQDRATLASTMAQAAGKGSGLGRVHERSLRALLRRRRLRRSDLVLSLAAWETGIPIRRLRSARQVADLVYG